jgi:hypothetical protein
MTAAPSEPGIDLACESETACLILLSGLLFLRPGRPQA